ncbi:MAG: proline dehydrogenase family protein [Candidatus Micrarchaeaceae archaeon]
MDLVKILAKKWIAGNTLEDALLYCKKLREEGIYSIVNFLSEQLVEEELIDKTMGEYSNAIERLDPEYASIAVKLTQIGLKRSKEEAESRLKGLLDRAEERSIQVWIDMEEKEYIEPTLEIYESCRRKGLGICIQSYLERSKSDIERLCRIGAEIRLVKGAYTGEGYENRKDATKNYYFLLDYLFEHAEKFTVATHDKKIIEYAIKRNDEMKKDITFAMLKGVKEGLAKSLAKSHKVAIYVPYGPGWLPYALRRIKEGSLLRLLI